MDMNSPSEIAEQYMDIGGGKARLPFVKLFVLAIFAGAFIAFGALASSVASCGVQPAAVGRILSAAAFPIGLSLVVVAGAELFTGNCLLVIPVLQGRASVKAVLYNWLIVYIGNFLGSILVSVAVVYGDVLGLYGGELAKAAVATGIMKVNLSFGAALIKGILCNIMVCLAVWMAFAAGEVPGKIMSVFLPVFAFVLCGFEHCVANMYFIPTGILAAAKYAIDAQNLNWVSFFLRNLIPVSIGNILGGCIFVGFGYWFIYLQKPEYSRKPGK